MPYDVSIVHACAKPTEEITSDWSFAFTTGYGAWALSTGNTGENKRLQEVPWRILFEVRYNAGRSFYHEQLGDQSHLSPSMADEPFRQGCELRLFVWTKTQSLHLPDSSGSETLMTFPWEKPFTYLCSYYSLIESGYYDEAQSFFLGHPFDPEEWAGKGLMVDDQSFFDAWVPSCKIGVYKGYWSYFMNRFSRFMKQKGLLSICHPKITEQTRFLIEGNISLSSRRILEDRMRSFFSSELQVGIYGKVPRVAVAEFHKQLPGGIRTWLERRKTEPIKNLVRKESLPRKIH